MTSLDNLLKFVSLTHKSHKVDRVARIPGTKRAANMVEHSWQLAMLAWYVVDTENLPLNKELLLKYALAHDLVETYAGDTYFYDEEGLATKDQREREALEKIAADHAEFKDLTQTITAYEQKADAESKFLYALDKIIDPLNIYLEDGLLWRENGITLKMLLAKKLPKISTDPYVQKLFSEFQERLEKRKHELFAQK